MQNENLNIPKKYWIFIISVISITFVLGMILENRLMLNRFDSYVHHYSLSDGGYTYSNNESFGFFVMDKTNVEFFYSNFIVPSLNGEIVCMVNDNPIVKGDTNETV